MTTGTLWTRRGATLLAGILLASASGAAAQTCRTSVGTGLILCDNGATARTSPVAGTTTFTDGRTARASPVTGSTRFSDGTSFRTVPVELVSTPPPPGRPVVAAAQDVATAPAPKSVESSPAKPTDEPNPDRP